MNKFLKRTLCFLLTVSAFMGCAVGCKDSGESGNSSDSSSVQDGNSSSIVETIDPVADKSDFVGIHDFTMTETNDYLVKDGKTDYVLVTASELSTIEQTAKDEFITLFKEATGIRIETKTAEGLTHDANARYICLGENELFASSGIELDKTQLTHEGVRIVTKDKTLYLVGGGYYGTLYSVYDFMELTFNFQQYYVDCMEIDTGVAEKKLYNYNVTDVPDINNRTTNFGWFEQTTKNRLRMPLYSGNYLLPVHTKMTALDGDEWSVDNEWVADRSSPSTMVHNTNEFLPRDTYSDHPKWFGDSGDVLCYTAHGDTKELELMAQECAKKTVASLMAYPADIYPNMNAISVTVEDNNDTCACEACVACEAQYGAKTAAIILFMNIYNDYVKAWMEAHKDTNYYRENFEFVFFAYNSFALAPATWDETEGKYVPNAPELVLDENVFVWVALMNQLEEELNIYHEKSARGREQIEKWGALSDGLWLWTYSANFTEYLYFHDCFSLFNSEGYQFFAGNNIKMYYQNAQSYQDGTSTGFQTLAVYLQGKLAWNTSLNTEELVDRFMNAMYKEAAPVMKEVFNSMRMHNSQLKEATEYVNSVAYPQNYPYNTLKNWMNMCDKALALVDDYRTQNPELYASLKNHIEAEWIFPAYATLQLRSSNLLEDDLAALKQRFKETGFRLGMTQTKEIETVDAFVNYLNSL